MIVLDTSFPGISDGQTLQAYDANWSKVADLSGGTNNVEGNSGYLRVTALGKWVGYQWSGLNAPNDGQRVTLYGQVGANADAALVIAMRYTPLGAITDDDDTFYYCALRGDGTFSLERSVAGTYTVLSTALSCPVATPFVFRGTAVTRPSEIELSFQVDDGTPLVVLDTGGTRILSGGVGFYMKAPAGASLNDARLTRVVISSMATAARVGTGWYNPPFRSLKG